MVGREFKGTVSSGQEDVCTGLDLVHHVETEGSLEGPHLPRGA
jgi:hypothetical protein